jgi:hypothetical protein
VTVPGTAEGKDAKTVLSWPGQLTVKPELRNWEALRSRLQKMIKGRKPKLGITEDTKFDVIAVRKSDGKQFNIDDEDTWQDTYFPNLTPQNYSLRGAYVGHIPLLDRVRSKVDQRLASFQTCSENQAVIAAETKADENNRERSPLPRAARQRAETQGVSWFLALNVHCYCSTGQRLLWFCCVL